MKIAVMGLGRVGLPLACVLANSIDGEVYAVDIDCKLIDNLKNGKIPFFEPGLKNELMTALKKSSIVFTISYDIACKGTEIFFVTVGTPIDKNLEPNIKYLLNSLDSICKYINNDTTIIIKSTLPIGNTKEIILPFIKERTNYSINILYSPERMLVGKAIKELKELPEIVGCQNSESVRIFKHLMKKINDKKDILITDYQTAEATKLVLNSYRYAIFALTNHICYKLGELGLDARKVIEIANHKYGRGNIPFPGLTKGPCLFKDTHFLKKSINGSLYLEEIIKINEIMPLNIVSDLIKLTGNLEKKRLGILGKTYKANVDDERDSLVNILLEELHKNGALTLLYDPYIKNSSSLKDVLNCNIIIIAVNHKEFYKIPISSFKSGTILYDIWGVFCNKKNELLKGGIKYYFFGGPIVRECDIDEVE